MITIKGFEKARLILNREIPSDLSLPPTQVGGKAGIKKPSTEETVQCILSEVQNRGDEALFQYTKELDKVELGALEVTPKEISIAYGKIEKKLIVALKLAADRIHEFHSICKGKYKTSFFSHGLGQQIRPLDRVGIYVPGGTAAYPSTVLMTVIPARVAGVSEIVLATPPKKDGIVPASTLVAADIAGADRIFKIGGAQAIAALAYGTKSVPRVDKICGPGNIFVAMAKKLVYGIVDIDGIQGPSEIIVVADKTADASFCAADLIAQAEHDQMASAILITTSAKLAGDVDNEIKVQLARLERQEIAAAAINAKGMLVIVDNLDEAIDLVNLFAPEHLLLMFHNANSYTDKIHNAGCMFINATSPVVLGDYIAGPSHVLPTGGTARFSSPLCIEDFFKTTNIISIEEDEQKELAQAAMDIAEAEGLHGHAQAIKLRLQSLQEKA